MTVEVVPARLGDALRVGRQASRSRHEIARTFTQLRDCRTLRVDGRAVAVYGLGGSLLTPERSIWLLASPEVRQAPKAFMAACRGEFQRLAATETRLVGYIPESDPISLRFATHWGFRLEAASGGVRRAVYETGANVIPFLRREGHPFVVYGLPRSRTRWLAEFLTYRDWVCHHQAAITMRSLDDVRALFRRPRTGSAEPQACLGWRVLHHLVPELRAVVVRRPVEECVRSMCQVDISGVGHYDPSVLRRVFTREARALDEIAMQPGVLSVGFDELNDEAMCARVFEHCLPFPFPRDHWEALKNRNIQTDTRGTLGYYWQNLEVVTAFKRECWRELRRLAYTGIAKR